jgi:hypothetical protein
MQLSPFESFSIPVYKSIKIVSLILAVAVLVKAIALLVKALRGIVDEV